MTNEQLILKVRSNIGFAIDYCDKHNLESDGDSANAAENHIRGLSASSKSITFEHVEEATLQYIFIATDDRFFVKENGEHQQCSAYYFMDKMKWFIESDKYKMV